jgi:hypothetical protein
MATMCRSKRSSSNGLDVQFWAWVDRIESLLARYHATFAISWKKLSNFTEVKFGQKSWAQSSNSFGTDFY